MSKYSNEPTRIVAEWVKDEDYVFDYLKNAIRGMKSDHDKIDRIKSFIKTSMTSRYCERPAFDVIKWSLFEINYHEIKSMLDGE